MQHDFPQVFPLWIIKSLSSPSLSWQILVVQHCSGRRRSYFGLRIPTWTTTIAAEIEAPPESREERLGADDDVDCRYRLHAGEFHCDSWKRRGERESQMKVKGVLTVEGKKLTTKYHFGNISN